MFTDNQKKEYMRMFFTGQPVEYYKAIIRRMRLTESSRAYLLFRYVCGKSDKEVARDMRLSWFYVNKKVNQALIESYDALKNLTYKDFEDSEKASKQQ